MRSRARSRGTTSMGSRSSSRRDWRAFDDRRGRARGADPLFDAAHAQTRAASQAPRAELRRRRPDRRRLRRTDPRRGLVRFGSRSPARRVRAPADRRVDAQRNPAHGSGFGTRPAHRARRRERALHDRGRARRRSQCGGNGPALPRISARDCRGVPRAAAFLDAPLPLGESLEGDWANDPGCIVADRAERASLAALISGLPRVNARSCCCITSAENRCEPSVDSSQSRRNAPRSCTPARSPG